MADYSVISDVSAALQRFLRQMLSPEPIQSPEMIALASPNDKNGDFQLGIFLYDIKELSEYRVSAQVRGADNTRKYPDKPLTLDYMLYVNAKSQIASGAETEQRIFGKAIQALMDNPEIDLSIAQPYAEGVEDTAVISIQNISFEDKTRIWQALNLPYQVAIYLQASPINISSRHEEKFTRVVDVSFDTSPIRK